MAERWDRERVLALAPDAPSQRTALSLASGRAWPATGAAAGADAVWGECRGSAAAPYRAVVDLSGPAYRCSCPSRKFPCKHVLALLLLWSEGSVPDDAAGPPDWAGSWLIARAAKASRVPAGEQAEPKDPRAAARRAEQRETRVASGLAELDRWLGDQVRQGLAASQQAGYAHWDEIAARMVDAQAPGLTERLRALASVPHSGAGWDGRLLEEYALLHLLAVAYRRQAELPPPLRDTVRSRIGFSLRQADVLAGGQPIRDHWQVLARRDLEQDRIRTRRTWLRGRKTGRDALLLSFAAAGQALDDSLAVGAETDADLVFYPGAVPLRAAVLARRRRLRRRRVRRRAARRRAAGWRHDRRAAGRVRGGAGRRSLAGQLARRGGDHPGPRPRPCRPRRGRRQPAAAPGGRRLLAAVRALRRPPGDAGRRVDPARPVAADRLGRGRTGGTAVSEWQDLVTASLIGTERAEVPAPAVPGLPVRANAVPGDPATLLLDRAALLTVARRGGTLIRPAGSGFQAEPLPAAEPDPAPAVSPAAGGRLDRMLGGEHPDLLAEWLTAAIAHSRRVPPRLLPALLDRVRRVSPSDPELRRLSAEAGGARARWLARLNPDWTFVTALTESGDDTWRLGGKSQRRGYLAALRARDPAAARELITQSWAAGGPERVMFLSVLANQGLSLADEPLLESALDERDAEVRGWAAHLLARLPGSALGQRMARRAAGCLRIDQGVRGTRLIVTPPADCDAAMRRDGVTSRRGGGPAEMDGRTHLLHEVLARTPLRTWTGQFGRTAEQILAVPSGAWAPVLFTGWSRAAMAQRDQDWMTALVDWALAGGPTGTLFGAETLRQLARRADPARCARETTAHPAAEIPLPIRDAISVLRFRYDMLKELEL